MLTALTHAGVSGTNAKLALRLRGKGIPPPGPGNAAPRPVPIRSQPRRRPPLAEQPAMTRFHDLDALRAGAMLLGIALHGTLFLLPDTIWPVQLGYAYEVAPARNP